MQYSLLIGSSKYSRSHAANLNGKRKINKITFYTLPTSSNNISKLVYRTEQCYQIAKYSVKLFVASIDFASSSISSKINLHLITVEQQNTMIRLYLTFSCTSNKLIIPSFVAHRTSMQRIYIYISTYLSHKTYSSPYYIYI